jgi:hypothetical protein
MRPRQTIVLPARPVIERESEPSVDVVRARSRFDAVQAEIRFRRGLRQQPVEAFVAEPSDFEPEQSKFLLRRS